MLSFTWIAIVFVSTYSPGTAAELVDLSYVFDNTTHYWLASDAFNLTVDFKGPKNDYWYEINSFSTAEHGGTHMDAPCHFFFGSWTVDQIPPERLVGHAAVVDISDRAAEDPDALLLPDDILRWRKRHGVFTFPTVVLVRTGFASRWGDRDAYFGSRPEQPEVHHYPGVGEQAALALAADPAVVGVGIDTSSVDAGVDLLFPTHRILGANNIYNLENLADMSRLPAVGARIMALPMKIGGGSGGPCRVLVEIPETLTQKDARQGSDEL